MYLAACAVRSVLIHLQFSSDTGKTSRLAQEVNQRSTPPYPGHFGSLITFGVGCCGAARAIAVGPLIILQLPRPNRRLYSSVYMDSQKATLQEKSSYPASFHVLCVRAISAVSMSASSKSIIGWTEPAPIGRQPHDTYQISNQQGRP
jgi:hypothetical protein